MKDKFNKSMWFNEHPNPDKTKIISENKVYPTNVDISEKKDIRYLIEILIQNIIKMKIIKTAKALIVFNLSYWLIYNTIFGWHAKPESELEATFDLIYVIIWKVSIVMYLLPLMDLYENKVKKRKK